VFLFHRFNWNISNIADFFAYIGFWIVLAQAALIRPLTKRFGNLQILKISLFILSIALVLVITPDKPMYIFLIAPFIALSQGISTPNLTKVVSDSALPQEQGKILGINQSVSSLAMMIPPIIAGFATNVSENLPSILAGIFTLLGWLILYTIKPKHQ
jgi:DHA1 family tetracycline resistance protein-like MFS transporter